MKGDNTLEAEMRWDDCLVGEERLGAAPTAARLSDLRWRGGLRWSLSGAEPVFLPQVLDLHENQLTALPEDIGQLTALQVRPQKQKTHL